MAPKDPKSPPTDAKKPPSKPPSPPGGKGAAPGGKGAAPKTPKGSGFVQPVEIIRPDGRTYDPNGVSLLCLKPDMIPRNWAIEFINTWWFDPLILMVILLNVSVMAWESPMDPPGTWKADFIDQLEVFFLYAYTVEMLLKMLAYGIIGNKNCYLHDGWCQLDFVVVSCAWAPILLTGIDLPNVNSLRALRAFRALRAMKIIPGLKVIVEGIMDVIPKLGNVTMLFIFVFVVFGIVGMELFQGMLHYRCERSRRRFGRLSLVFSADELPHCMQSRASLIGLLS